MTEQDLLAGIADNPCDPDGFLILADWLEDQGDPRSELARLRHPDYASPARQAELVAGGMRPVVPTITNGIGMQFALVLPGTFWMGSPFYEVGRTANETLHQVTLTQPFYMGVYPVTLGEYEKFVQMTGYASSEFRNLGFDQTARHPVLNVNWHDAQAFAKWLNLIEMGDWVYSLPTEAQWEYACRAGTETAFWWGNDANQLGEYAWFDGNSGSKTYPVETKKPNPWGLWHMLGNVWEWCEDWYGDLGSFLAKDPVGASEGSLRVMRGGGWSSGAKCCRSAYRYYAVPGYRFSIYGFRLVATRR